ncbi:MAG: hypothetical protein HY935_04865, partial [Nitrosomonadales bacterium]|nr:hypothetical protein [Nitrosomonadales bacterium]
MITLAYLFATYFDAFVAYAYPSNFSDVAAMPQKSVITSGSCPRLDCVELNPQFAFLMAMEKLQATEKTSSAFSGIKALLKSAGFNQNGRNRITHLSSEEIAALCDHRPIENGLWLPYVSE